MAALATATRAYVERLAPGGVPQQCRAGGRHYVVTQVHGHWVTGTPWWLTGQEVEVHTWRVSVTAAQEPGGTRVVDLHCTGEHWRLTRVGGAR
jgi:DNA primase